LYLSNDSLSDLGIIEPFLMHSFFTGHMYPILGRIA
jgi:hypothetical protein